MYDLCCELYCIVSLVLSAVFDGLSVCSWRGFWVYVLCFLQYPFGEIA